MKFTDLRITAEVTYDGVPYHRMTLRFTAPVEIDTPRANIWGPFVSGGVWFYDAHCEVPVCSRNRSELEEIKYDLERGNCFDVLPIKPAPVATPVAVGGDR